MKTTRTVLLSIAALLTLLNAIIALLSLNIAEADFFSLGLGGFVALGLLALLASEPIATTYDTTPRHDHRTPRATRPHLHQLSAHPA